MRYLLGFLTTLLLATSIAKADSPSVHGMLLFGDKLTYASHLPMFHAPHDYQLVMKLNLTDLPRSETLKIYEQAKADQVPLFTLVPEVMDLSQIINGSKTNFTATIFEGHFERGGQPLGKVAVSVNKLILAAKLDGTQPIQDFESYLVFGEEGEYFATHVIKSKPSFDTISTVEAPYQLITPPCRRSGCPDPVKVPLTDEQLPITVHTFQALPSAGDSLSNPLNAQTTIKNVIYLEEGELSH